MKSYLTCLFLVAASVVAQNLSSLPSCATAGLTNAITASGCGTSDIACICKSTYFTNDLQQYAKAKCSVQDYNNVIATGQSVCAGVGVTLTATTASTTVTTTTGGSGTMSATMTSTATNSGSAMMMTTASRESAAATATATDDATETCTCCSAKTSVMTTTPAMATYTGAAVGWSHGQQNGLMMMMMFGAAAAGFCLIL